MQIGESAMLNKLELIGMRASERKRDLQERTS
jgi:hypothetical protein